MDAQIHHLLERIIFDADLIFHTSKQEWLWGFEGKMVQMAHIMGNQMEVEWGGVVKGKGLFGSLYTW